LLHGLSIDFPLIDGGTMDEPWTNHGGTPYQTPISDPRIQNNFLVSLYINRGQTVFRYNTS
ncbi:MAG: hypothetical protein ACPGSG_00540, partial [Prolixibacteraceae bacterium]